MFQKRVKDCGKEHLCWSFGNIISPFSKARIENVTMFFNIELQLIPSLLCPAGLQEGSWSDESGPDQEVDGAKPV